VTPSNTGKECHITYYRSVGGALISLNITLFCRIKVNMTLKAQ